MFQRVLVGLAAALVTAACGSDSDYPVLPNESGGSGHAGSLSVSGAGTNASAGGSSVAGGGGTQAAGGAAGAGGRMPTAAGSGGVAGEANGGSGNTAGAGTAGAAPSDLWIAPDGDDSHAGTEAEPLQNLPYAAARLKPGHTVWIKAGTYRYTTAIQLKRPGSAEAPYTIAAAPGARPLIDFATPAGVRGFELQSDYWKLVGLEVAHASDNCVAISGSYNVIENLRIHNCGDTGLQITVGSAQVADATRGAHNLVLNTDSYENFDAATGGENADGFAAKLRIGAGNVFRGCRAYNNADDGWDLFAADDVVEIDGCWAFLNGKGVGGKNPAGDGNGFKLGGKPSGEGEGGAVHEVKNSFAFENLTCGYTQNSNPDVPKLTMCGAKDNKTDYCQTLSISGEVGMSMTAAQAKAAERSADGSLPPMK